MVHTNKEQGPFRKEESAIIELDGRRDEVTPLPFIETMRSFNKRLMKSQVDQNQINVAILEILTDLR